MKKTLGGERVGSGSNMQVELHNYGRSTHNLDSIFRTTMSIGTLVPFMNLVVLPGDTFEIDLNADVKTLPTRGPLFGSLKLQMDVYSVPVRLFQGKIHNNKLNVGMDMSKIKLPLVKLESISPDISLNDTIAYGLQQVHPSSIFSYLGTRGLYSTGTAGEPVSREINAIPFLAYWDIYKNYYANKQEEIGAVVHTDTPTRKYIDYVEVWQSGGAFTVMCDADSFVGGLNVEFSTDLTAYLKVFGKGITKDDLYIDNNGGLDKASLLFGVLEEFINIDGKGTNQINLKAWQSYNSEADLIAATYDFGEKYLPDYKIGIGTFDLNNIDKMRELIYNASTQAGAFVIDKSIYTGNFAPYVYPLSTLEGKARTAFNQEGLALKTYQSDIFNNWLSTEWIDGENGISAVTAISTTGDMFTLDTLNLSKKVYDMLNRIAVSGGSYNDWMEAVYGSKPYGMTENPMYMGGLSKEVIFQEVVSQAKVGEHNPLGSLAGRGRMGSKHKGGKIKIRVDEPSIIMGIVSLTPRIDYSQGNDWAIDLKTMDDFHKPALDEIGFQDLITEQMAWWDSVNKVKQSAGKQPAWINYMTNFNKTYGNFADPLKEMFMTFNRQYEVGEDGHIKDLTTYIDPVKYNYMFAQTSLDAQNFWVQIAMDIQARRKMSSKIMPNL